MRRFKTNVIKDHRAFKQTASRGLKVNINPSSNRGGIRL